MQFIDLKSQYQLIKPEILLAIEKVLDSGQFIMGEEIYQLESALCQYTGSKYCITVADGTKALLIALMALDIKAGDEVIVPAFTFIATASMVALLGAIPIFVDVEYNSYNLDTNKLIDAITHKTKAIILVNLFGQCADIDTINAIAKKHNIFVIEDAAQSFGASYKQQKSCTLTDIACTSFFPTKPLGCYGDGGACFTNSDKLATKIKQIRSHGESIKYHHDILGVNGRLDTLQASILLVKLTIFDNEIKQRVAIATKYNKALIDKNCITPEVMSYNQHIYAQYTVLVTHRKQIIEYLQQNNIPIAIHYPIPLHKQPILKQFYLGQDLSVSEKLSKMVLSLPMHPYLKETEQNIIIDNVLEALKIN